MVQYYIGLSFLSTKQAKTRLELRTEARRVLSGLEGRSITDNEIAKEENGRPFFPGRETDFNISHSKNMVVVSLIKGQNPQPRTEARSARHEVQGSPLHQKLKMRTGCDIEFVRPRVNASLIAEEFFSSAERDYVFPHDKKHYDAARFFHIWTLKECFLKLRGFSVFDMAKAPSFIDTAGRLHFVFDDALFILYELSDGGSERYVLASAIEGDRQLQPTIQWFSLSSLPHRILIDNISDSQYHNDEEGMV